MGAVGGMTGGPGGERSGIDAIGAATWKIIAFKHKSHIYNYDFEKYHI